MKLSVVLLAAIGCASPRVTAPPRASLSPALASLAFYVGEWDCKGTTFAAADQPEKHWDAKVIVTPELDGSWLSVQMIGPGTNHTVEHKGYDSEGKRWVHVAFAGEGFWTTYVSPGWTGSQMQFAHPAGDPTVATFTKIDDHTYSHAESLPTEHGLEKQWEKVCSKHG